MLGTGTTEEFSTLELKDKRLITRSIAIGVNLQKHLTSCIKRLFIDKKDENAWVILMLILIAHNVYKMIVCLEALYKKCLLDH
jgi:hypothetical protein